jgi:hypothetical protein
MKYGTTSTAHSASTRSPPKITNRRASITPTPMTGKLSSVYRHQRVDKEAIRLRRGQAAVRRVFVRPPPMFPPSGRSQARGFMLD